MTQASFGPGSLVRARGREWIVLGGNAEVLRVRPVSSSEDDQTLIHLALEAEPVTEASFRAPDARQLASQDSAILLRDALLLSLRRGAGPFRGFGHISVEPRAYQLVPLLMALKLDPVRLLIADDVGIGKTIEAGLIARELLDRGDIDRMAVLCPPHLVEQWLSELEAHFHIRAVAVTAAGANRLERGLPLGSSIFSAYPHTVVSLDYIKSDTRRSEFLRACPGFVIVDEAHTCAAADSRQRRYELLRGLSENRARHLVLLTATPHSGDEAAFYRLLGLLDPAFEHLADIQGDERARLRERLSHHFVQRRRLDIDEWKEGNLFPKRQVIELTYQLTGAWDTFLGDILDYCADVIAGADQNTRRARLNFWATLALMRCVASSPAAGMQALRTRAGLADAEDDEDLKDRIFDGSPDGLSDDDVEPPAATDDPKLVRLIEMAERLAGQADDPKLTLLIDHLGELLREGFCPVVFCRYIATAHYLGDQLKDRFDGVNLDVITGELTSDERREKVAQLGESEQHLLIATDCLSEGVNLQEHFDAVVHYDLSWNPTRHEQREGRVDRFGQRGANKDENGRTLVRATLIYGANNPVDGAVLEVILEKAAKIRKELGVLVPLPDSGHALTQALMRAVFLRRRDSNRQQLFDFAVTPEAQAIETKWQDAAEKAKRNRTVFAQVRLKPAEVLPEWHKSLAAIGGKEDVRRFTDRALARLGAALERHGRGYKAPLDALAPDIRERLEAEGLEGTIHLDFEYPAAPHCRPIQRSHPLVAVLADTLLERSLETAPDDASTDPGVLGRVGCWVSPAVTSRTTIALLRLRHQLVTQRTGQATTQLVEEASALGWAGTSATVIDDTEAMALLLPVATADPPHPVRDRSIKQALEQIISRRGDLEAFAERRAQALLADHRRVREAADARGSYAVKALLPVDVIGLYVLLPGVS